MPAVRQEPAPPVAQEPAPRWGSYVDAAALAKVSVDTIKRWIRSGKIGAKRDGASYRVLVNLADIDKLVDDVPAA
jgi:excisionase family DNA binding protein